VALHHHSFRSPRGHAARCLATALATVCAGSLRAQQCERVESRTGLGALSGERVRKVDVVTGAPADHGVAGMLARLHIKTRASAIQQRVLVRAGEPLDTMELAESLRRLRRLRFLDDVSAVAERCEGVDGIALTIATRDAWSTSPELRLAPAPPPGADEARPAGGLRVPNGLVGLEERNFLGLGREMRAGLETREGRLGGSVQLVDPFVLGLPVVGRMRLTRLPNEHAMGVTLRSDERDAARSWRGYLAATQASRWSLSANSGHFDRTILQALAGRRVTAEDAASATYVGGGVELAQARLTRFDGMRTPGPAEVARRFAGLDLSVDRTARRYAPNTWLLPREQVFDVPRGLEYSAVLGFGVDGVADRPATHFDGWVGRIWTPGHAIVSSDLWSSGFLVGGRTSAGVVRSTSSFVRQAPHGVWSARLVAERLTRPDPDVRSFLGLDPTAPMLDQKTRLAGGSLAASIERAYRVELPVGRAAVDIAGFAAASLRRATCGTTAADVSASALGIGLRAAPSSASRSSLRLDLVVPTTHSAGLRGRPFATLTFAPGLTADRIRDALRPR